MDPINSASPYFNYDLYNNTTADPMEVDDAMDVDENPAEKGSSKTEDKSSQKDLPNSLIARRYQEFIDRLSKQTGLSSTDLEEMLLWIDGLSDHEAKAIAEMLKTKYGKEKQTENQELKSNIDSNKIMIFAFLISAVKASQSMATVSPQYACGQVGFFNAITGRINNDWQMRIPNAGGLAENEFTKQMKSLAFKDSEAHKSIAELLTALKEWGVAGDNARVETSRTNKDSIKQVEDSLGNDSAEASRKRDQNFSKVADIREKLHRLIQSMYSRS